MMKRYSLKKYFKLYKLVTWVIDLIRQSRVCLPMNVLYREYTVPDSIRYPLFIYKCKIAYNLQTKNLSYRFVAFSLSYNYIRIEFFFIINLKSY